MKNFFSFKESKNNLIGLGVFALYSLVNLLKGVPLALFGITELSENMALIYSLVISILLIIAIIFIYKDKLIRDYNDLKKNHQTFFYKYLKYWLFALVFMAISNLIILSFIKEALPTNEVAIKGLFTNNPIVIFLSAVVVAPILEELVFRQSFRDMFNDDAVFIFMTAFTFGAFHVVGTANSFIDLVYIIPYGIPAVAFSLMLKETNNIFVPMGFHFLHNGVLIALQFFILIFG